MNYINIKTNKKFKKVKGSFGEIYKIPIKWEILPLKKVSTILVPMRNKPKKFDGNIPWLRIEDIIQSFIPNSFRSDSTLFFNFSWFL